MVKLNKTLWITILFGTINTTIANAKPTSVLGYYKSNGYIIDIVGQGDYYSCDPRNRCLRISYTKSSQDGKTWIWRQGGSTYRVTPLIQSKYGRAKRISVKVIGPSNKVVFNRIFRSQ